MSSRMLINIYARNTVLVLASLFASVGQTQANYVANGSFEQDFTPFYMDVVPTGWEAVFGIVGVFDPNRTGVFAPGIVNNHVMDYFDTKQFASGAPDGNQVLYIIGGAISQDTQTNSIAGKTYVFDFWVGQQLGLDRATDFDPFYSATLFDGGTVIASTSGNAPLGVYTEVKLTAVGLGGDLSVEFTANGQDAFDKVNIDINTPTVPPFDPQVPEPTSLGLLAAGIAGILGINYRRKSR